MIIKTEKAIPASEITDPLVFNKRRQIIKAMLATMLTGSGIVPALANNNKPVWGDLPKSNLSNDSLLLTPAEIIKNHTNYYEFSFNKTDATTLAQSLPVDPWSVEISGEVEKPGSYYLEDILRQQTLQEHIYRFRCVEAWSMVVPWVGFSLGSLLKMVKPLSTANFVKFTTVYQPKIMPSQANNTMLEWPYVEALRMDEAMHPLTILAVGMYGDTLPKQNGAPLRLVVPWKYGFKSIKAIVKIELLKRPPTTTWNKFAPNDYGFYANVNPEVAHPRWSQNSERQLGSSFFTPRRQTELFNGYGEQVASLYSDMDLRHFF
ncbi:protein-methionine-sulfoxide reductase catalytic subunit MsrP [Methylobacter psychrophilus]|uniref:protein-methionine-sulfoxide reductase catalytic subunit MsrP n=1 Tax=Methylobacter psychrophilus TaxID=96941 RepID=UPI0021D5155E|nr:protein-methionine-sulfoxide reductase catalytic subunit MsrP [Methylobacter psychrophilus]